jgi:hypothetical protein
VIAHNGILVMVQPLKFREVDPFFLYEFELAFQVGAAGSVDICFTNVSTWLPRMRASGTSSNGHVRSARLIARSVPRSHTWRAAHCS